MGDMALPDNSHGIRTTTQGSAQPGPNQQEQS